MNDDQRRVCIECRHCDWPSFATGLLGLIRDVAMCGHADAVAEVDPVTGEANAMLCRDARNLASACGADGVWWEQRKGAVGA